MSVPENIGVVIGIVFLTCIELKIYTACYMYAVHKLQILVHTTSGFELPLHGYLVGARLVLFSSSCSPVIFRESHGSVSINSYSGYEIATKRVTWEVLLLPGPLQQHKVNKYQLSEKLSIFLISCQLKLNYSFKISAN